MCLSGQALSTQIMLFFASFWTQTPLDEIGQICHISLREIGGWRTGDDPVTPEYQSGVLPVKLPPPSVSLFGPLGFPQRIPKRAGVFKVFPSLNVLWSKTDKIYL
jgi:hypothetical protein